MNRHKLFSYFDDWCYYCRRFTPAGSATAGVISRR